MYIIIEQVRNEISEVYQANSKLAAYTIKKEIVNKGECYEAVVFKIIKGAAVSKQM